MTANSGVLPATELSDDDLAPGLELGRLIAAATAADGHAPFGEHVMLTLDGQRQVKHARFASRLDGRLAGYLVLSEGAGGAWYADAVAAPALRGRGVGTALFAAARDHVASHGGGSLRAWAYTSGAPDALVAKLGMRLCRAVSYRTRPLTDLPAGPTLSGVRLRSLRADEVDAWLTVSNAAFEGHPENGGWTQEDLRWRLAAPWSDLSRFVVAADARSDELLAGVWTKVEPASREGELYVVAVRPDHVGRGLGRAVVGQALATLAAAGLEFASLYVDTANTRANALYTAAGFTTQHDDRCFELTVP